jgi:hypothetical protein
MIPEYGIYNPNVSEAKLKAHYRCLKAEKVHESLRYSDPCINFPILRPEYEKASHSPFQ